jgi:hypothetical protein
MKMTTMHHIGVGLVGVLTALTIAAQPAHAARRARGHDYPAAAYVGRHQSCATAYDTESNPNYGFGPRVCVGPTDVAAGDRIMVVIRIHSFVVSFSAPTTADGLTRGAGALSMHLRRRWAETVTWERKDCVRCR